MRRNVPVLLQRVQATSVSRSSFAFDRRGARSDKVPPSLRQGLGVARQDSRRRSRTKRAPERVNDYERGVPRLECPWGVAQACATPPSYPSSCPAMAFLAAERAAFL